MSRANQWFVPADGIAREVITEDIQRYLGPDALVRPGKGTGENEGEPGYWITAYRTLTSEMIQDLKLDSQRWQQERHPGSNRARYQDSRTHAARQHWGPSYSVAAPSESAYDPQSAPQASYGYATEPANIYRDSSYDSSAHAGYGGAYSGYPTIPSAAHPRAEPTDSYAQHDEGLQPQQYASYPAGYVSPSAAAAPGYYIASDGRQYPLAQQPQRHSRSSQPVHRYATRSPQANPEVYSSRSEFPQDDTRSPGTRRLGKRSDDDGKGAGGMNQPYG